MTNCLQPSQISHNSTSSQSKHSNFPKLMEMNLSWPRRPPRVVGSLLRVHRSLNLALDAFWFLSRLLCCGRMRRSLWPTPNALLLLKRSASPLTLRNLLRITTWLLFTALARPETSKILWTLSSACPYLIPTVSFAQLKCISGKKLQPAMKSMTRLTTHTAKSGWAPPTTAHHSMKSQATKTLPTTGHSTPKGLSHPTST